MRHRIQEQALLFSVPIRQYRLPHAAGADVTLATRGKAVCAVGEDVCEDVIAVLQTVKGDGGVANGGLMMNGAHFVGVASTVGEGARAVAPAPSAAYDLAPVGQVDGVGFGAAAQAGCANTHFDHMMKGIDAVIHAQEQGVAIVLEEQAEGRVWPHREGAMMILGIALRVFAPRGAGMGGVETTQHIRHPPKSIGNFTVAGGRFSRGVISRPIAAEGDVMVEGGHHQRACGRQHFHQRGNDGGRAACDVAETAQGGVDHQVCAGLDTELL